MKTFFSLLLIMSGSTCIAQGVFTNKTSYTLEKIIQEYPGKFKNIRGALISSKEGSAEYASTIDVPGAISTTVTESAFANRETVSWQSVLYSGNEFSAARSRFEELFTQIKNTIIKPQGERPAIVNGEYKKPAENSPSTTITFDLLPATGAMQKINIDLMLKNMNGHWQIVLSINDNDRKETSLVIAK